MTIWILAFVLLAALAGVGYRQGAIRAGISLVGILIAALLAGPLAKLVKPLLPHLGLHNPIVIWLVSPLIVFVILLSIFKSVGFFVHRKVEVHYRYQTQDIDFIRWERLNRRVGLGVGLINGLVYLVLISFVIFDFSYWTVQTATSPDEPRLVRLLNQMGRDLESTGLAKVAYAINPMPAVYFKAADFAGLLYQNPQLRYRLADYPPFLSLDERDDFKQLGEDASFQNDWKNHSPIGQLLNNAHAKAIWQNNDTLTMLWSLILANFNDLQTYLQTGHSPKYGGEKILGRWDFNVVASIAVLSESQPNISSSQMQALRALWTPAYANTVFIACVDHQAFLENLPHFQPGPKGQPPTVETTTWNGTWQPAGKNYDVLLSGNQKNLSMTATTDGQRLTLNSKAGTYVFDRE